MYVICFPDYALHFSQSDCIFISPNWTFLSAFLGQKAHQLNNLQVVIMIQIIQNCWQWKVTILDGIILQRRHFFRTFRQVVFNLWHFPLYLILLNFKLLLNLSMIMCNLFPSYEWSLKIVAERNLVSKRSIQEKPSLRVGYMCIEGN